MVCRWNFDTGRPSSHFDSFAVALLTVFQVCHSTCLDYLLIFLYVTDIFIISTALLPKLTLMHSSTVGLILCMPRLEHFILSILHIGLFVSFMASLRVFLKACYLLTCTNLFSDQRVFG